MRVHQVHRNALQMVVKFAVVQPKVGPCCAQRRVSPHVGYHPILASKAVPHYFQLAILNIVGPLRPSELGTYPNVRFGLAPTLQVEQVVREPWFPAVSPSAARGIQVYPV
jgi:hypothetical protein